MVFLENSGASVALLYGSTRSDPRSNYLGIGDETTSNNFSVFVVSEEKQSKRLPPILMQSEVEIEPRTKSRISCEPTNNDQFTRYRIASFLIPQNHTLPVHLRVKYINQGYPDVFHLIKTGKSEYLVYL